jgi:hypothetical protein
MLCKGRQSICQCGTLWVPQRLANALVQNGLGITVEECLKRVVPLRKAATSLPKNRPMASEHYDSLGVRKMLSAYISNPVQLHVAISPLSVNIFIHDFQVSSSSRDFDCNRKASSTVFLLSCPTILIKPSNSP